MRVQIEDYYGNDIIKIEFCLKDREISRKRFDKVNLIAIDFGYSVADTDTDEQGEYIRVQQIEDKTDIELDLDLFVGTLTAEFK